MFVIVVEGKQVKFDRKKNYDFVLILGNKLSFVNVMIRFEFNVKRVINLVLIVDKNLYVKVMINQMERKGKDWLEKWQSMIVRVDRYI